MRDGWKSKWGWRISAVVLVGGVLALGTGTAVTQAGEPDIQLSLGHMVDHPARAHYVLWNGPAFLDIGVPEGGFVRFAVANVTTEWSQLNAGDRPLPVAVRYDGRGLVIRWLPYDGPGKRPAPQIGKGMSDADRAAALQKLSETR